MATVASVFQTNQIGVETTPGVAVPANRLLSAMGIDLRAQGESNVFGPAGQKYDQVVSPNKLWSTGAIAGAPTYTELQLPLSSILEGSVVTAAGVSTWHFLTHPSGPDAVKTFTVEGGSSAAGEPVRITNGLVRSFSLVFARNAGISMTGEFVGRALQHGITLTAAPTALPLIPIVAKDINVYMDATAAGLGTTQLLNPTSVEIQIQNKFGLKYVLDRAQALSPKTHVELKPQITVRLRMEADTQGLALLDQFSTGAKAFIRIDCLSSLTFGAGPTPFSGMFDIACAVERPEGFGDEEGVRIIDFTLRALFDGTWGKVLDFMLVNNQATL